MSTGGDPHQEIVGILIEFSTVLHDLGIIHALTGSVASGILGEPRATNDIDLVADIREHQVSPLVARLSPVFFVQDSAVRGAVQRKTSFSAIHLKYFHKVDVFVRGERPDDARDLRRAQRVPVIAGTAITVPCFSAEDLILRKIDWFRRGFGVSDQQWRDVKGVLKVQAGRLDLEYLKEIGASLGLQDLLAKAMRESGYP